MHQLGYARDTFFCLNPTESEEVVTQSKQNLTVVPRTQSLNKTYGPNMTVGQLL